jgi:MraZ protein
MFVGRYVHNIDEKGRIILPAPFRRSLEEQGADKIIVTCGLDKCLSLYTREEWMKTIDKMKEIALSNSEVESVIYKMCVDAAECVIDDQGRLNIPNNLKECVSLKKEVVIVGRMNKIEIWDKGLWEVCYQEILKSSSSEKVIQALKGLWI